MIGGHLETWESDKPDFYFSLSFIQANVDVVVLMTSSTIFLFFYILSFRQPKTASIITLQVLDTFIKKLRLKKTKYVLSLLYCFSLDDTLSYSLHWINAPKRIFISFRWWLATDMATPPKFQGRLPSIQCKIWCCFITVKILDYYHNLWDKVGRQFSRFWRRRRWFFFPFKS